jgi:uncharacterized membrane-anchored protein
VTRYGLAALIGGVVILGIGLFLQATAYAALAGQAMTTGAVILMLGVVLLAVGAVIRR